MAFSTDTTRWQALCNRTLAAHAAFIYGVITTRIFCRPTCPARLARRANVVFFNAAEDAVRAGFRACKRCKPDSAVPERPNEAVVRWACSIIRQRNGDVTPQEAAKLAGLSYRYFHEIFKDVTGVTPAAFARQCREEHTTDAAVTTTLPLPSATTTIQTAAVAIPDVRAECFRTNSLQSVESSYQQSSAEDPDLEQELDWILRETCQDYSFAFEAQAGGALSDELAWAGWPLSASQVDDLDILNAEWIM